MEQLLNGPTGVIEGLDLPFYSSTPDFRFLGRPGFCFPSGVHKGSARDVVCLSSRHKSDLSSSPSPDDVAHAVLVAAGERNFFADGLGPEYSQDSCKVLGVEGKQFFSVILQHSEA